MIKAVIFDMYETLITHYEVPLYFGAEIARDLGLSEDQFFPLWKDEEMECNRTVGKVSFEEIIERILRENHSYSPEALKKVVDKRVACKVSCFHHLHPEIIPMMEALKELGIRIGLISNCYSEEVGPIRNSCLFPYFDGVCLSYEEKMKKPQEEIFARCLEQLGVDPKETIYVGDGGSRELETAAKLGMQALQAVWYFRDVPGYPSRRKDKFVQLESPMDVVRLSKR